ncbi:uncharacterized protein LAESUDRAFT_764846 [Laetiporus sulphureus 93-53]|uniref:Uncharacterized protein n=1 Tax=Laetiporus sulphureus 93-53 TaxID=1314785 RepID=A0A165B3H7_9APHY|nr:uncharacterized protein LAESUDRAFT_764846 [Laetiporus sulphureus 93-53]KZT00154.1 hypothetical protein LAESUDRAFT_764846 [Laetiporus sulphureus 93-53]
MPSSSQHPATPVASPRKAADPKDAVMGIVYSAWEAFREAEPLDPAMDFEFLIRKFLSAVDLSPPLVTEASAHMPSNTGEVMASDSLTASTGTDDAFLSVALTSSSVVAAPVMAPAAIGIPVPKFEFQACATNPVAINPPSDSGAVAMKVDPPLATVVTESPSAQGSEVIEVSSNDEDDSNSDEVEFMSGNLLNLSPVHPKKGKGHGRKFTKASKITTNSEDQVSPGLAEAVYRLFVLLLPSFRQGVSHLHINNYSMELELLLDTPIDEYETVIALAPHLRSVHTLPDTPEPNAESDAEGTPEVVTIKQEKGTAGPSRHKLVIPLLPCGQFNRPLKCPHFNDSDPDNIMMQHAHASTIVVPSTKVLKPHSSKGKAHAKGSFKAAIIKSEPFSSLPATIEPSETSTQLEWMIALLQQLHEKNQALRARKP